MFKFIDAYTLRARLVPAVIAAAPALAAIALLILWNTIALSNVIATGALLVLLYALADFARRRGKRIEPVLYREMGGKPSTTMMRYADSTFDPGAKERYRNFLSGKINSPVQTEAEEKANLQQADTSYGRCGDWLRENTRDTKKFPILFDELVTYGFRRNLLAVKWPALLLNLVVVACSGMAPLADRHRQRFDDADCRRSRRGRDPCILHCFCGEQGRPDGSGAHLCSSFSHARSSRLLKCQQ